MFFRTIPYRQAVLQAKLESSIANDNSPRTYRKHLRKWYFSVDTDRRDTLGYRDITIFGCVFGYMARRLRAKSSLHRAVYDIVGGPVDGPKIAIRRAAPTPRKK